VNGFEDGTFRPDAPLSRQEAAITLSRILHLKENSVVTFTDQEQLPEWSRAYVGAAADARLIDGYQDGSFGPLNALTRAEAVQLLDRSFGYYGQWYGESGTYGSEKTREQKKGSDVINSPGVTLQNMEIAGDLIISKQVGDGDVFLKNVKVQGRTLIYGGGENSVHMEDSVLLTVIINKKNGTVRLVAEGKTTIQEVTIQSATKVDNKPGAKINHVTLSKELPEKSRVHLNGGFNSVDIKAKGILVQVPSGTIDNLTTDATADSVSIELNKEAKILEAILRAAAAVLGEGNIGKVTVNAKGVSFAQQPGKVEIGSDVPADTTINVGGSVKPVTDESSIPVSAGSGSSNSGNGGSNPDSSGGSNPGSGSEGSNNNGSVPPMEDMGFGYSIALESDAVTVNDSVYVYSPRKGTAYLAPATVDTKNKIMLEEAVNAGIAKKVAISAYTRTEISTQGLHTRVELPITGFQGYSEMRVAVLDDNNMVSNWKELTLLDGPNIDLKVLSFGMQGFFPYDPPFEKFHLAFNRKIQLLPGYSIRDYVQVSLGSETPDFKALKENDPFVIEVKDNKILINPTVDVGQAAYFRVLPGAIETTDSVYKNDEYLSTKISSFVRLTMLDFTPKKKNILKVGSIVKFTVSRETDVYFVYYDAIHKKEYLDKEVRDGHGLHVYVPKDSTDKIYEFDTKDLQAGEYLLYAIDGASGYAITLIQ
ncbi:S-layer homology domain-containing protein, partial [Paenibacillus chitinolyticus]|uniref:S-layer homology domain-containing protein n=1 Tax=Paenibacillus chitinolyticus TaxID=79263 RepID=UPI002DBC0BE7